MDCGNVFMPAVGRSALKRAGLIAALRCSHGIQKIVFGGSGTTVPPHP
jgi:hypothetical protein